jgi:AraC-like DNA-binding protein
VVNRWPQVAQLYDAELEKLREENPERFVELALRLAQIYEVQLEDIDNAIGRYKRVIEVDAENQNAVRSLDRLYLQTDRWADLAAILEREAEIGQTPDEILEFKYRLGQVQQLQLKNVDAAIGAYRDGLNAAPEHVNAMTALEGLFAQGIKQPEIFQRPPDDTPEPVLATEVDEPAGYERSGLTQAQAEAHVQRLVRLLEEKQLHRNSLLTLDELAGELRVTPHHLSQVINTQLGKNFYDFVNGYRVEETKRRLRDPKSSRLTILAIALECGFNTKSSFNTVFKKHTGVTPSQYRSQGLEAA